MSFLHQEHVQAPLESSCPDSRPGAEQLPYRRPCRQRHSIGVEALVLKTSMALTAAGGNDLPVAQGAGT